MFTLIIQNILYGTKFDNPLPEFRTDGSKTLWDSSMAIDFSENAWLSRVAAKNFVMHHPIGRKQQHDINAIQSTQTPHLSRHSSLR
jgi:hypothetical protein